MRLALQGIVREWQDLAEALGLPYSEIEVIEENNPYDMKQCVREVVHQWFKGKGSESPSWTSLCTALKDPLVNRKDIASKIEEQYLRKSKGKSFLIGAFCAIHLESTVVLTDGKFQQTQK